jgi:sortase A
MVIAGVAVLAYVGVILIWGDPATGIYTAIKQDRLAGQLSTERREWVRDASAIPAATLAAGETSATATAAKAHRLAIAFARRYRHREGVAIGRIHIRRLGLNMVLVEGTGTTALQSGPGHYANTAFPGLDRTVAVAGHRTTFAAPFRHIDDLVRGDRVVLEMPYATFTYTITGHAVVANTDWSIIRDHGYDRLVLSACHPVYFASQRYVAYARLTAITFPV